MSYRIKQKRVMFIRQFRGLHDCVSQGFKKIFLAQKYVVIYKGKLHYPHALIFAFKYVTRPPPMAPSVILLCLTPDDFTCQCGKPAWAIKG